MKLRKHVTLKTTRFFSLTPNSYSALWESYFLWVPFHSYPLSSIKVLWRGRIGLRADFCMLSAVESEYRMQLSTVVSAERLCPFLPLPCCECGKAKFCSTPNACVPRVCVKIRCRRLRCFGLRHRALSKALRSSWASQPEAGGAAQRKLNSSGGGSSAPHG